MTQPILETLKNLISNIFSKLVLTAKQWDLRAFVLATLFFQSLLLLAAPFRKQTSNPKLLAVVWFAYLFSDWASNYSVGLIPASKDQPSSGYASDLLMFWAPFSLLHVGGADSISALTSTDNELWSRFAIQLATMSYGVGNAFYRSFLESKLRVPVLLMFVAGLTKYIERLLSFFQARFSALKESLLEEKNKSSWKALDLEDRGSNVLSDATMVKDAYCLFESSKVLFVDLPMDSEDRKKSREYFLHRNPGDAFRVLEIELNFYYDLFYSKVPVIRKGLGRFLRPVCIVCEVIALVLWFHIDKRKFREFDIRATYALLLGAVARDFISLLMITFSDWTIASIVRSSDDSKLVNSWLSLRKRRWDEYSSSKETPLLILISRAVLRRWSESISQLNFIYLSLDLRSEQKEKVYESLGIDFFLNKVRRVPKKWFTNDLRDFVFQELKNIASEGKNCLNRGQWTLENYSPENEDLLTLSKTWVSQKAFGESLLLWHIATTLCYHTEKQESLDESEKQSREFSKVLSDYMLYLLVRSPEMMLEAAAMGDIRFEDTRAEAKRFFRWLFSHRRERSGGARYSRRRMMKVVCKGLLREVRENEGLRDERNSVLFDASRLATELKELEEKQVVKMWEVIAKVWMEMLSHGAVRCSPRAHAAQLANGGELITLVWQLMEHLGLGKLV